MPFIKSDEEEISGMGINIANAILEEHGFSVTVEEIKNGTRLVIKL
jgi:nitrogen-specific signal transduction histidine kinase